MLQRVLKGIATALVGASQGPDEFVELVDPRQLPEADCFRRSPYESLDDWHRADLPGEHRGTGQVVKTVLVNELRANVELLLRTDVLPGWGRCRHGVDGVRSILEDLEREVGQSNTGTASVAYYQQHPEQAVGHNPLARFDSSMHEPEGYRQRLYENMERIASAIGRQHLPQHRRSFADLMMYIGCLRVGDPMG